MDLKDETKQTQVFFVDDEAGIRKIVRLTLEEELLCSVTCFDNATESLQALRDPKQCCHLLITDIKMPGMDGLALLSHVRQVRPLLPILIVTGHGDVPMAVRAFKNGAFDFIEKPLDESILLPVVRKALKGSANLIDLIASLTDAEKGILRLVSEGKSNSEMAYFLKRSIRTVERHRYQLMHKLNVNTPAELTKVALALGLTSLDI